MQSSCTKTKGRGTFTKSACDRRRFQKDGKTFADGVDFGRLRHDGPPDIVVTTLDERYGSFAERRSQFRGDEHPRSWRRPAPLYGWAPVSSITTTDGWKDARREGHVMDKDREDGAQLEIPATGRCCFCNDLGPCFVRGLPGEIFFTRLGRPPARHSATWTMTATSTWCHNGPKALVLAMKAGSPEWLGIRTVHVIEPRGSGQVKSCPLRWDEILNRNTAVGTSRHDKRLRRVSAASTAGSAEIAGRPEACAIEHVKTSSMARSSGGSRRSREPKQPH